MGTLVEVQRSVAILTTTAAIATNPGVINSSFARMARGCGPERLFPEPRVSDVGPRRIVFSIYQNVQRLHLKKGSWLTFRIVTPPKMPLPAMIPSLYRTEQYLG